MRRRELLGAMAAGPLAVQLEQLRRRLDGMAGLSSGERDADEWERAAAGYSRQVAGMPAAAYLPHLLADAAEVTDRVDSASGSVRVRLERSAARIAALAAMGMTYLGDEMTAGRWWRTSVRVAGQSGDGELVALVLGKQAVTSMYGSGAALALARAGEALAVSGGRAYAGTVFAHQARARYYGMSGMRAEALSAVVDLKRAWERLGDADVKAGDSAFGQPERILPHTEAWVLAKVGDTRAALKAQDAYLTFPVSVSGRAKVELLRAETLIRAGDVDGGARRCVTVLGALGGAWRRERDIASTARAALGAVPARLRSVRSVQEAREALELAAGQG